MLGRVEALNGRAENGSNFKHGRKGEKQWDYLPHVHWGCEVGVRNIAVAAGPGGGLQTEQEAQRVTYQRVICIMHCQVNSHR